MNTDDPTDLSPLSYGPGLTLGLLLILGLPAERTSDGPIRRERAASDSRLVGAGECTTPSMPASLLERTAQT